MSAQIVLISGLPQICTKTERAESAGERAESAGERAELPGMHFYYVAADPRTRLYEALFAKVLQFPYSPIHTQSLLSLHSSKASRTGPNPKPAAAERFSVQGLVRVQGLGLGFIGLGFRV